MDNLGNFVFMQKDTNKFYIINDTSKYVLNLDGIIPLTDDTVLQDWKIFNKKLFLILNDKRNIYIQSYFLENGKLDKELISSLNDNEIISSYFFSITDNKIEFVNRWKNDRWVKEYIDIN